MELHRPSQRAVTPAAKPSKVYLLADGPESLRARLDIIDSATAFLDLQYYLWHSDEAGMLMAARIMAAADRGVRVRILLDDIDTAGRDQRLLAFHEHPNVEVRLFNPFRHRWLRPLELLTRFREINRRMHNKALSADGSWCVVGGRNIGNEYFGMDPGVAFNDLDVLAHGPVAAEASANFNAYWTSPLAVPVESVAENAAGTDDTAHLRSALQQAASGILQKLIAQTGDSPAPDAWSSLMIDADARLLADRPDKSWSKKNRRKSLASQLMNALQAAQEEVLIVSPYFVPRRRSFNLLQNLSNQGVRVHVLTNSLASSDVVAVHAGYAPKRRRLLGMGINLNELQPNAGQLRRSGKARIHFRPSSGRSSLHAKVFVIDRRWCFIGSFNLDPRSIRLNTEMGVMLECPTLAQETADFSHSLISAAYKVGFNPNGNGKLTWTTHDGIRFEKEPHAGAGARLLVKLLGLLPIEAQL